jgi:hypothetical protein
MSIPIGTKMLTKPPKQKSKTHLKKTHTFKKKLKKKNLHKTRLNSTMNNDLCISQTYSNDNVKTRLHDTYIVMNKGEINTGESNENENVHKFNESVVSKNCCFKVKFVPF